MRDIGYERKLRYLQEYMNEWVSVWPNKIKPFDGWLDSKIDKKINKGKHIHNESIKKHCCYCGREFIENYLDKTKDHIIPLSKGGLDKKENRRPCCFDCNQWKDNKHPEDWMKELQKLVKNEKRIKLPYSKALIGTMIGRIKKIMEQINEHKTKVSIYKI